MSHQLSKWEAEDEAGTQETGRRGGWSRAAGGDNQSHLLGFPAPSPKAGTVSAQLLAKGSRVCPPGGSAAAQAVSDAMGPVRVVGSAP